MKLLSLVLKPLSRLLFKKEKSKHLKAIEIQLNTLGYLINNSHETSFGLDYGFDKNTFNYDKFCHIKIQDYESLKPYIDRVRKGEENVLWKGKPIYFAKTSGTTSGAKYIPITKESIGHHIAAARNSLFAFIAETGQANFFDGKMIFLQGSPEMEEENGIKIGRLSGIVYHHVPAWLMRNRKPSYATNCIADWEQKLEAIVSETKDAEMSLLSGIPPWCVMYFEQLLKQTSKENLKKLFPKLELYVHGGVNYLPYKDKIKELLGAKVATIETYPASEGFFAYQDSQIEEGLLLNIDAGIFYEFVNVDDIHQEHPKRIHIGQVELNTNYVLIVSTNAGLWVYNTGDTIKFVSLMPYRIVVTGRVKHFISAFGEHVIQEEVEYAISKAAEALKISVIEFTVAPYIAENEGESYHDWYIEVKEDVCVDKLLLSNEIDKHVQIRNSYYKDLREGNILGQIQIQFLEEEGFKKYFESKGKLGGQNKVQHLSNDRDLVNQLRSYVKKG